MALFEFALIDSLIPVDLSLEQLGDGWLYEDPTTLQMYDLFIQGHMQSSEDTKRMEQDDSSFQEMWEEARASVNHYLDQFKNP